MLDLRLTYNQHKAYERALRFSRKMYLDVRILDQNENQVSTLTATHSLVTDGQVDVDTSQGVQRSLTLDVVDPMHRLYLDPAAPHRSSLYPGRLARVIRWDFVYALGKYVACPVFFGPVTKFKRQGHMLNLEGQSKESLYLDPCFMWEPMTFKKGFGTVQAIHDLLYRKGERRFDLPHMPKARLPQKLSLTAKDEPWKIAQSLARSINRQLFFDAEGRVRLRSAPSKPNYSFYGVTRSGKPESTVLDEPEIDYDFFGSMRNTDEVLGPQPAGKQRRIRFVAFPARRDPLSPWSLAIHGAPRYLVDSTESPSIKRLRQAQDFGARRIRETAQVGIDAMFDCLPAPHLEPNDYAVLVLEDTTISLRMQKWSIPLLPDGKMTVGSHKQTRLKAQPRRGA